MRLVVIFESTVLILYRIKIKLAEITFLFQDEPYLQPYLTEVEAEIAEKKNWEANNPL